MQLQRSGVALSDSTVAKCHVYADGVRGARRIQADLRDDGRKASRNTVAASTGWRVVCVVRCIVFPLIAIRSLEGD